MTEKTPIKKPAFRWISLVVLAVVVVAVAVFSWAVLTPSQNPVQAPENDAAAMSCSDSSADGSTCCKNIFNLQEENRNQMASPTVVDYSEATGNLLIRGPEPVILRSGAGNQKGCLNSNEWHFAYDELNGMIRHEKDVAPAYFSDSKKAALIRDLQDFNLSDYQFIDISLLNAGDSNAALFAAEKNAYGGSFSTCSGSAKIPSTIRSGTGNLIWSNTIGCPGNDDTCINNRLWTDNDGFCSYADTVNNISAMLKQKDPSGKKTLIYYHCNHGADRTGGITIGYLLKANPAMTFDDAVTYTTYLGQTTAINRWTPEPGAQNLANAYCKSINGLCRVSDNTEAGTVSGTTVGTVLPTVPSTVIVTPQPTATTIPSQTAVTRYNPATSGNTF
ncbi:hypothetical protein [Methanoregula sp.]|uniref:hypothetical protein n=1 Tax=Methanoregula sp. TaxID=2052170 RepID=UPI002370C8B2|nr:hypothetical protein [Methanoregula sp.]MDD1686321.1 dual specificity protein phosphatase family protein [Methanoregula sp.]